MSAIQSNKDMRRSISEFIKATDRLELCTSEVKNIVEFCPKDGEMLLQKQLENYQFDSELKKMKVDKLKEEIEKYGYIVSPEIQISTMRDELKDYKNNFIKKVNEEVQIFKVNIETQLTNKLRESQLEHDKELGILKNKLELSNEKLNYVCRLNDINIFKPVTSEPVTSEPVTSQPVTSEPVTSQPVTSEPVTSEPVTSQPVTSEPVTSQPVTSEPVTSEPVLTSTPVTSQPVLTSTPVNSHVNSPAQESQMPILSLEEENV